MGIRRYLAVGLVVISAAGSVPAETKVGYRDWAEKGRELSTCQALALPAPINRSSKIMRKAASSIRESASERHQNKIEAFIDSLGEAVIVQILRELKASDSVDFCLHGHSYLVVNNLRRQKQLILNAPLTRDGLKNLLLNLRPLTTVNALLPGLLTLQATPLHIREKAIAYLRDASVDEIAKYFQNIYVERKTRRWEERHRQRAQSVYDAIHRTYKGQRQIRDFFDLPLADNDLRNFMTALYLNLATAPTSEKLEEAA